MSAPSALLQAARLWERTSAKGTRYMSGRLGGVKVVIMPNRDFSDGTPTQRPAGGASGAPRERARKAASEPRGGGSIDDDPVPF